MYIIIIRKDDMGLYNPGYVHYNGYRYLDFCGLTSRDLPGVFDNIEEARKECNRLWDKDKFQKTAYKFYPMYVEDLAEIILLVAPTLRSD